MSKPDKKLFLIDAFALIFRAHFALSKNPSINSKGQDTGAILGFMNSMLEVIKKEKPTHLAVCFDRPEPTFRHEEFVEYKAQREAAPEGVVFSIPYIKSILAGWGIPVLEMPGYEADDVVGTVAKDAAKNGYEVYMMTLDKDYAQLVDENLYFYKLSTFGRGTVIYDIPKTLEKWEIERVDQVRDLLGLWGDASDNIPGIPGIGEKTAKKLIAQYDSVENLIAHSHELKGKQKENVENFGEQGILSKRLATIVTDVPIEYNLEDFLYKEPEKEKIMPIFEELEFRAMAKRVFGVDTAAATDKPKSADTNQMDLFSGGASSPSETVEEEVVEKPPIQTIHTTPHDYHLMDTPELRASLISFLSKQNEFCFDTETTSLDTIEAELVGIAFSYYKGEAYYVPVPADQKEAQAIVDEFKAIFANDKISKIGQNLKYDIQILRKYDTPVSGPIFDTMLAHYLIDPETRHNMDVLAENYLNYEPVSIESLIGKKGVKQGTMRDVDPAEVKEYAGEDADVTYQLKTILEKEIKDKGFDKLLADVEIPLVHVLSEMEYEGVRIDVDALKTMSDELQELSLEAQTKVFEIAGQEFNLASPKQLGEILFDKLKLVDKPKKTKTGQYATGEEILTKLAYEHDIANKILEFREYQKLKSTYVDALPKMVSDIDGRVHTDYRQTVAATGRLSSNNPNLQNIPVRTEKGREIRKAFIPRDEDHILLSADYSQIELRIMAEFAQDESMLDAFKNGRDIHSTTASKVFKVPLDEVTGDHRRQAKAVNFGIIYGISAFGLSQNLSIPRKEAAAIIEEYFIEFPAIKTCMDSMINKAREFEYAETILGRKRLLRDINSRNATVRGFAERNAINAPIQGSAADMIKIAMINIHEWMKKEKVKSKMILQVHDELIFDVHKSELDLFQEKVPEFMKTAIKMEVPMEIGMGVGQNWLEAH